MDSSLLNPFEIECLDLRLREYETSILNGDKKVSLTIYVLDVIMRIWELIYSYTDNSPYSKQELEETPVVKFVYDLINLFQTTVQHLKVIKDIVEVERTVDISDFRKLQTLEIRKVDIVKVLGLNSLRSQLHELICSKNGVETLKSLLEDCGGDFSSKSIWAELKNLVLTHNDLTSLDGSLECAPWLTSLDLSHNKLVRVDEVSLLSNLKNLNLSYNKLNNLPKFTGQICNRLQVLNVSNNFLEEIQELKSLVNISELDLSNNCLIDHVALVPLSHMAALQWLSLFGNPLFYHVNHSKNTCVYLHSNIEPQRFILDQKKLTTADIKLIGTFHPLMASDSLTLSSGNLQVPSTSQKCSNRKVREVDIEDDKSMKKIPIELPNSFSSIDHLEVKNQVKTLRETYGESWLNYYRALSDKKEKESVNTSQDISGFEVPDEKFDDNSEIIQEPENKIFDNAIEESSDEDDIEVNSEETIYYAKIKDESDELFLVFTNDTMKEIDCTTSKERSSWVLNTIMRCEILNIDEYCVKITFHTLRKDKKQRVYILQPDDVDRFYHFINKILTSRDETQDNKIFQCMKCSEKFSKNEDCLVASYNIKDEVTSCPSCGSNIIVQENVK